MARMKKPRVGELAVDEFDYWGNGINGEVGIIIKCLGIRCVVQWADSATTRPERSVLEVISYASRRFDSV